MKANFNIAKNVRNSRSISALSALRKLQSLGLLLCALLIGSLQMWGAIQGFPVNFTKSNYTGCTVISGYPATWTSNKTLKTATKGVYFEKTTSGAYHLFTIPVRDFAANDSITVTLGGVQVSNTDYKHTFKMQYSTNGSSYTDFGSTWTESGSATQIQRGVKIPTAVASGSIYIKILSTAGGKSNGGNHYILTADITYTAGSGSTTYSIDDMITGSGSLSYEDEAEEDDEVVVTVTPTSGNYLSEFYVYNYDAYEEVPSTRVDETHYSFVMPDADVTIFATFDALPSYSITYNTPTCVTSPSGTLTSQTYFATPSESVPGYRFEGWVASAIPGTTGSKPGTIYQPGEVIPNNNMTVYALYSQVSATFTKQTGSTMPADGGNYMLCNSYSATARVIKNAVDASKRATTKEWDCSGTTTTCTDWECIWVFKQGTGAYSGYWFIYNPQVGKYLGANSATAHASSPANYEVKLIDGMSDASAWTCTVASGRITLVNKLRSGTSGTNETKLMSSGNYAGFGYSSGTAPYFFKNDAVSASYTTNPTCPTTDHTITFNANGGSGSMSPITDIEDGDGATLTSNAFTKTGYTFGGWTADVTVTIGGSPVSPGSTIVNGATLQNITSDINLTAIWTPNPYRVDVASPGHVTIGVSSPSTIAEGGNANVNCGATVTLSQSGLESGYSVAWDVYKTGESSTKVSVTGSGNGATFVMPAYGVTVNVTITAPYIYFTSCSNKLKVYYNANTSDVSVANMPTDNNEYDENDYVSIPNTTPTRTGYTFYRWYTNEGCTTPAAGYAVNTSNAFQITANTTLYAKWNVNEYRVDVATPDRVTIKATPSGGSDITEGNHANAEFGQTVTLNYTSLEDGYGLTWDVYKTGDASTKVSLSSTIANNATFTMPAYPVTVTATTAVRPSTTVTFYLGTSNTASGTLSIGSNTIKFYNDEVGITALPTVSSISCGDWNTVVGWTEDGSYSSSTTPPTLITASVGTPYKPATDKTVYAVYRKVDGSDDFDGTNDGTYYIRATPYSTSYYASECMGSDALLTSGEIRGYTSDENKVAYTFTKVTKDAADYYNITCDGTHYLTSNSGSLSTTETYNADAALWSVSEYAPSGAAGTGAWRFVNKSTTRNFVFTTNSRNRFVDWANGNFANSGYPLELLSASTNYYSVNPECTSITVTKGTCTPASSVLDADDDYCDFKLNNTNNSSVTTSSGGNVTIYLYPNDDYTDVGATVSVDVPGNVTTINAINTETHTCMISGITGDITVSVSYVERPKYTVHLYDQGNKLSDVSQTHYGENVTLPSGTFCGSPFAFVGWTDNATQLAAAAVKPNIVVASDGLSSWAPTAETTLYAVYSKSITTCDEFASGASGAYYIYYDASNYAVASATGTQYSIASSGTKQVFYIGYSSQKGGYTISTSEGYLGWNSDGSDIVKGASKPYYWTLTGSANNWKFLPGKGAKELKCSSSNLKLLASGTAGKIYSFEKASNTYYYTIANCTSSYTVTFKVHGDATISGSPSTPGSSSYNSSTHVLSGLAQCNKVTTFPTASYDGWQFLGWSTEDYSYSGKHTTDYATENASTDEPDASIIYKTGGNSYTVMGSNIELWPVFSRYPDNEPFNTTSGGEYYIYYLDPSSDDGFGAPVRVYAGSYEANCRYQFTKNCAAATTFTFEKSGDYWTIKDGSNYIGTSTEDLTHSGSPTNWTLSIYSGNQFDAVAVSGRQIAARTDGNDCFKNYDSNNLTTGSGIYHRIYLGTCTERIFSSEPNPTPTIDLTGEPYVTATNGQEIRATATMTVSAAHLTSVSADKVIVSGGTGLRFATAANATPTPTVSLSLTEGNLAATTIYVYYNPSATEDGIENIVVTAKAYNNTSPRDLQTTGTVHARHLPADFVIAAKWEGKWYALPNTCTFDGSSTAGVLITVDNDNDPTAATYAPSSTKWGLRKTKAGSRTDGSHNDRMVFTERATATANNQMTLYNFNSADVYANATYANYNSTNPTRYEWTPVSSDFKDYTLTNASESKPLILRNDCEFKAQTTNQAYDGKVRLLPATFYEDNVQIIEWKASSVVIMYTGTETTAKAKAGSNSETSAQTLSSQKLTHGIYEVTTGTALTGKTGENLILTFGSSAGKKIFEIPWIINGSANATSGHEKQDVVILNNGKLTAQSTKYSFRNIYVYGGGKLKIASGTSLGVNNIILRAGRISTNGTGGSATYNYDYPQVELGGTLTSTKTDIKYEYITDYDHWYHLCLPFDATLNSIHYPTEYYGQNVQEDNKGSWIIKRYDGATRATGNYAAWVDIESESATVASAGHGYIFWGAPKKLTIGGDKQRQKWGIQRMTMSTTAAAAKTAENANKTIDGLSSYSGVTGNSGKVNDQGWNLIGNPYLMNLSGLSSTSLKTGKLIEEVIGGNKTGHWVSNNDGVRYVTVPDNHFDNYTAQTMAWFTSSNPMVAGRAFFVQIDGDATAVQFNTADRKALLPALFAKVEESVDIETGIVMSDESKHDEVNFWIKDGKTAAYEKNADYPKTPNSSNFNIYGVHETCDLSWIAISPEIAEGSMAIGYQVPAAGEYRLSLSETYVSDKIEQLLVTDHAMNPEVTTNLMIEDYLFLVNQAETNNERFTVSIKIKSGTEITTDIDDIRDVSDQPKKFLYRDKMYILRGGKIYDATGKQVREIK